MNNFKEKITRYGIWAVCAVSGAIPFVSYAAAPQVPSYADSGPITTTGKIVNLVESVLGPIFGILMVLSIILMLYAAFLYVTAGGDSEKVSKANQTLTYAVIGIVVALLASGIPLLVKNILGGSGGSAAGANSSNPPGTIYTPPLGNAGVDCNSTDCSNQ